MTDGRGAATAHIDGSPEPRRSQMRRLHQIITASIPEADVSMSDDAGPLLGYGSYDYKDGFRRDR